VGGKPILQAQYSLLHMSYGTIMLASGMVELGIMGLVLFGRNPLIKLGALGTLSLSFILYHFGKWYFHLPGPCPCLGTATSWLPVSEKIADYILKCLIGYFFVGGFGFYFLELRRGNQHSTVPGKAAGVPISGVS
jgi:hypothetical protein